MKTSLLILTLASTLVVSSGYAAPRSKATPAPAPRPVATQTIDEAGCTKMVVRVPGRKTPRTVECGGNVCPRDPRCAANCAS